MKVHEMKKLIANMADAGDISAPNIYADELTIPGIIGVIEYNNFGSWHVWHVLLSDSRDVIVKEVNLADDSYME